MDIKECGITEKFDHNYLIIKYNAVGINIIQWRKCTQSWLKQNSTIFLSCAVHRIYLSTVKTQASLNQSLYSHVNTLRPRQNGCHFPDVILKWTFLNENLWISLKISLKFVPKVWINIIPALVQIMAWHRPGDGPLSEPMMVSLLTHIYVTRPQWVKCRF